MTENRHVVAGGGEREWRVNVARGVLQGEGTIPYTYFNGGYMTIGNYQNSSDYILKIVDTLINENVATLPLKKRTESKNG